MSFAYLPLFTGDYLRDTRHLTPLRHGIYLLLLMHCWDQQGPIPLDEQEAAGIANCRSADEIDALRYVIERYFVRMDDGWYNKRMMAEIEASAVLSGKRAGAAHVRWEARKKIREIQNASAMQMHSKCNASAPSPSPSPSPRKEEKTKPLAPDKPDAPGVAIWNSYRTAYASRYSVDPVRNAKVNSQLKQLSQRLGEDAPSVAAFYLSHKGELYVRSLHTTDLLLRDAEKLHTEWKTNRQMSSKFARKADQSIGQGDVYANVALMLKGEQ